MNYLCVRIWYDFDLRGGSQTGALQESVWADLGNICGHNDAVLSANCFIGIASNTLVPPSRI